jgi:ankyrin repeat protein
MALLFALRAHDVECVRYALDALGADVRTQVSRYQPPMHSAIAYLRPGVSSDVAAVSSCLKLLIDHGAPVDERNADMTTPLTVALDHSSVPVVELLLDHAASICGIDGDGLNAIEYLAGQRNPDKQLVEFLRDRYQTLFLEWWAGAGGPSLAGLI